jgi:hypothetical protein
LSAAEAVAASSTDIPYRIIRIYELGEDGATARISRDINALASSILESIKNLPNGVLPVGFTIHPDTLEWDEAINIQRPDEPDDDATLLPR